MANDLGRVPTPDTEAAKIAALADRCEAATGPDRGLDRDIADALGLGPDDTWERPVDTAATETARAIVSMDKGSWIKAGRIRDSKRYTASLDAAMTLVPDEHDFMLMHGVGERALASVQHTLSARTDERHAATPALALCAAALRASLKQGEASDE